MSDPLLDRTGHPIREGAYVRVEFASKATGLQSRFRMVVTGFNTDKVGPYVEGAEWRDGRPTGNTRLARAESCEVRPPIQSVKDWKADRERFTEGERQRAAARIRQQKRKRKTA